MTAQAQKQSIRQQIIALRDELPAATRAAHNTAITARLTAMPEYQRAKVILGYMNFGSEFASELWVKQAQADGKKLILPKANPRTKLLELYQVENCETQLAPGLWEIREPIVELCTRVFSPTEVEFILLPGIAFTRDGARLGYGGGFYDRLLAGIQHRPSLVAGAFSTQVVQQLPQIATDRKVEWLVTEDETIHCS
jgi:5-formyltetrahydrofolate cyclo-ligase